MTTATCEPQGFVVERRGDHAFAALKDAIAQCTICNGTGLTLSQVTDGGRTYDVSAPCARSKLTARMRRFNQAHIPAALAHADIEGYRPARDEQARAKAAAREFAFLWPKQRGFMLSGPVGTGKSHLLAGALRVLTLEHGAACAYVEMSLLYAQIRRGFQDGKSGGEIIGPLAQVDVLAIDELGKGRGSPFELETLDELIARRYNAGRTTLFATNYSLRPPEQKSTGYLSTDDAKEAGRESKLLCDRVGERIYSRLCEMCDFIEFPGDTPDLRRSRPRPETARR